MSKKLHIDNKDIIDEIKKLSKELIEKKRVLSKELYEKDKKTIIKKISNLEKMLSFSAVKPLLDEVDESEYSTKVEDIYNIFIANDFIKDTEIELKEKAVTFDERKIKELLAVNHYEPFKYILESINNENYKDIISELSSIFLGEELLDFTDYNVIEV
jgi:hypothetical protein